MTTEPEVAGPEAAPLTLSVAEALDLGTFVRQSRATDTMILNELDELQRMLSRVRATQAVDSKALTRLLLGLGCLSVAVYLVARSIDELPR